jgi:anti-sigma factor RsiW
MFGHVERDLTAYAEEQLDAAHRARVEAHLAGCLRCSDELKKVRQGVVLARELAAEPMPGELAARIRQQLLDGRTAPARPAHDTPAAGWWRVAAAAVVVLITVAGYWHVNRPWIDLQRAGDVPTAFEREGRLLHDALTRGTTALAFHSADDQAVWAWLAKQRAPVTTMAISRPVDDRGRFVPVGATVRTLAGAPASVLSYRIDGRPVTLALAASADVADAPAPGWWNKRVTHRREGGVNTLTWTVGGGTYVMVAELDGAGQRACQICHTSPAFKDALQRLAFDASAGPRPH